MNYKDDRRYLKTEQALRVEDKSPYDDDDDDDKGRVDHQKTNKL